MITINLKPGSRRAKAGVSLAGGLGSIKALTSKIKDPWPVAAVAVWVVLLGFIGWVGLGTAARMRSLGPELEKARSENKRYRAFLAEKKHAEGARDSVLIQIATISQVDGDRYVWPHILDEVTHALPDYTWLTDMDGVLVHGRRPIPGAQKNTRLIKTLLEADLAPLTCSMLSFCSEFSGPNSWLTRCVPTVSALVTRTYSQPHSRTCLAHCPTRRVPPVPIASPSKPSSRPIAWPASGHSTPSILVT